MDGRSKSINWLNATRRFLNLKGLLAVREVDILDDTRRAVWHLSNWYNGSRRWSWSILFSRALLSGVRNGLQIRDYDLVLLFTILGTNGEECRALVEFR